MNGEAVLDNFPKLLQGAWLTLELVAVSGVLGLLLALPLALARTSPRLWVQALPWAYIYFFRGTPLLVRIFLVLLPARSVRGGPRVRRLEIFLAAGGLYLVLAALVIGGFRLLERRLSRHLTVQ